VFIFEGCGVILAISDWISWWFGSRYVTDGVTASILGGGLRFVSASCFYLNL